jgi:hypothetical protein
MPVLGSNDTERLSMTKTAKGVVLGSCGFRSSANVGSFRIKLTGRKERYDETNFDLEGIEYGEAIKKGSVLIDRKDKKAAINIVADGKPCWFNGTYSYKDE